MLSAKEHAIANIESILATHYHNVVEHPIADVIADLIHYCEHNSISLAEMTAIADTYVTADMN